MHIGEGGEGQPPSCNATSPGAPAAAAAALGEAIHFPSGPQAAGDESLQEVLSTAAALGGCPGIHRTICSAYFLTNVRAEL